MSALALNGSCFTSLILREKNCINPICTKPRLRGCMIAALDRASSFWQSAGTKCLTSALRFDSPDDASVLLGPEGARHRLGRYGKAAGSSASPAALL
jgi:hypothetical protein